VNRKGSNTIIVPDRQAISAKSEICGPSDNDIESIKGILRDTASGGRMPVFVLRLRDGNCIVADAVNEAEATESVKSLAASEVVTVRKLESFIAQFSLTDEGELASVIMDKKTISDLYQHEYPLLQAAHAHSYQDFGSSETDSKTEEVLFSSLASLHAKQWDKRDKEIVECAVEQERLRFAN
jgi:hypothetical protein